MVFPTLSDSGVRLPIRPQGIAFDLDGTLLDYDGRLSEAVANAVRMIARGGIKVFIVTGRLEFGCVHFWDELGLDTPMATCNGACVGFPRQEPFLHLRLSAKARDIVIDLAAKHHLYINYYIDNRVYTTSDSPEREFYERYYYPVELVPGVDDILDRNLPTKCMCLTTEDDQERVTGLLAEALGTEAALTCSSNRFIEVIPVGASKALGLKTIAEWSGIPMESFVAVGDAMNDLPMLEAAGFAITFKSGDPRLVDYVDMLLPPLWEDGMELLAKCILGLTQSGRFLTARSQRFFRNKDGGN